MSKSFTFLLLVLTCMQINAHNIISISKLKNDNEKNNTIQVKFTITPIQNNTLSSTTCDIYCAGKVCCPASLCPIGYVCCCEKNYYCISNNMCRPNIIPPVNPPINPTSSSTDSDNPLVAWWAILIIIAVSLFVLSCLGKMYRSFCRSIDGNSYTRF
jgi:hypothetical protein